MYVKNDCKATKRSHLHILKSLFPPSQRWTFRFDENPPQPDHEIRKKKIMDETRWKHEVYRGDRVYTHQMIFQVVFEWIGRAAQWIPPSFTPPSPPPPKTLPPLMRNALRMPSRAQSTTRGIGKVKSRNGIKPRGAHFGISHRENFPPFYLFYWIWTRDK